MDRPIRCRQHDLLVRASNVLVEGRIPPQIRAEVTLLLKLLIAKCSAPTKPCSLELADE